MGVLAGLVAMGVTVAIERWGGAVGGLIGTLPTTIVPAAIGMHAALPTDLAFQEALAMTPVGMLLDAGFLWLWRELPRVVPKGPLAARLTWMTVLTLTAWMLGAVAVVWASGLLREAGGSPVALGVASTALMVVVGVAACWTLPPTPAGDRKVSVGMLFLRGLFAGSAIVVALLIAASGHGLMAGVAAVFPAIFLTSMLGLWLSQGEAVPAGAVGPMMLGATSVAAFALLVGVSAPSLGLGLGVAVAWVGAVAFTTVPARVFLVWRARVRDLALTS